MPQIDCYIAGLKIAPHRFALQPMETAGNPIEAYFASASGGALSLRFDASRAARVVDRPGFGVSIDDLHDALEALLPSPGRNPMVGLIFASFFRPNPNAYGQMFDLDASTRDFVARQGCVVYLDKISAASTGFNGNVADPVRIRDLACHVAAHELGHCFNLWHRDTPETFMLPAPKSNYRTASNFSAPGHAAFLASATDTALSRHVLPGGTDFGDRGPLGEGDGDAPFSRASGRAPIELKIALTHKTMWHFDPVELVVEARLKSRSSGSVLAPLTLDPGYASCQIMITRPDGERRRFAPGINHCSDPGIITITGRKPYKRDIAVWMQKGRYTFDQPGRYSVQMFWRISASRVLKSNTVECDVRAPRDGAQFRQTQRALCSPVVQRVVRTKRDVPPTKQLEALTRLAGRSGPTGTSISYALGVALLRTAAMKSGKRAARLRMKGRRLLKTAIAARGLGGHRRQKARTLLAMTAAELRCFEFPRVGT